ncbi:MAG: hypothetical protein HKO76_10870 [Acidimicrobiia bacterium]|nr:hypothetical protein [Acidimicrobiia bacterium]
MRLRAIAGLLTLTLVAAACSGAASDEEPTDEPVAAELPATQTVEDSPPEDPSSSTMIPTTTLATYPSGYSGVSDIGGEGGTVPQAYFDRSVQIDAIQEMVTAQVQHDWDVVYDMATPAHRDLCPFEKFESLTAGMDEREVEVAFGDMKVSQGNDAVYADFNLFATTEQLPVGFRVGTAPELVTNRVVPSENTSVLLGELSTSGFPHELLVVESYGIEGVVARVGGQMLAIEDGRLMMAENPCLVAELAAKTTGGLSMWVYPTIEPADDPAAADAEADPEVTTP